MTARPEITGKRPGVNAPNSKRANPPANQLEIEDDPAAVEAAPPEGDSANSKHKRPPKTGPPPPTLALTIRQFCASHNISEAFYYELQKHGKGPRTMQVGRRRLISLEEAKHWRELNTT